MRAEHNRSNTRYPGEIEFEEMEDYRGGKGATFKEIVLRQFNRCIIEGSKPMITGGVETRLVNGVVVDIIVPNQIEIFTRSVDMLKVVLSNYFKRFEDKAKNCDSSYLRILKLGEDCFRNIKAIQEDYENAERKKESDYKEMNAHIEGMRKEYEFRKQREYEKILTEMSCLLAEMNWFEEDSITIE